MEYTNRNDLERKILPSGAAEAYTIDLLGNRTQRVDARGVQTNWTYNLMDRVRSIGSPGVQSIHYTFTPTGMRKETRVGNGFDLTHSYSYDSRDRLLQKVTPEGTLIYTYDPAGNVATMRSSRASGVNVSYGWDAANQLVSVTDHRVPGGLTVANYTLTGQTAAVTPPTGVTATYTRDALDRVTNLAHAPGGGGSPLASYAYTLGPAGHRLSVTELSGRSASYGYDVTHRLTSETVAGDPAGPNGAVGYTLDPVANRLARASTLAGVPAATYGYDVSDQLTSDGYDLAGNTLTRDGDSYTYDPVIEARVEMVRHEQRHGERGVVHGQPRACGPVRPR